jgi:hypothetical protein
MQSWLNPPVLILFGILGIAAIAFVTGAMLWLKRLRQHLGTAVGDALSRQVQHGRKVEEALDILTRNQKQMEAQVQAMAQINARLRADLTALAQRVEQREMMAEQPSTQNRILH